MASTQLEQTGKTNVAVEATRSRQAATHTILLVEDEDFVRKVTGEVLRMHGYRVLEARNAAEALRLFSQRGELVELLVSDIMLPDRGGRELAKILRSRCPGLQIIFISGFPENTLESRMNGPGMTSYLPKPFSAEQLTARIRKVFESMELQIES